MTAIDPRTANFLCSFYCATKGQREEMFQLISGFRDAKDTDADLYGAIDSFLNDVPTSVAAATKHLREKHRQEIESLSRPIKSTDSQIQKPERGHGTTQKLVEHIEQSLVQLVECHRQTLSEIGRITGYAIEIFPEFGEISFHIRTDKTPLDSLDAVIPNRWDRAHALQTHESPALAQFESLRKYLRKCNDALFSEDDKLARISGWDQWIRLSASIALCGDRFNSALRNKKLFHLNSESPFSVYCNSMFVPRGGDYGVQQDGFNFVTHLLAMRIANSGVMDASLLDQHYESFLVPFD